MTAGERARRSGCGPPRIPPGESGTRLTGAMAFGQHPGPPASSRQVDQLLDLLHAAGHESFKDARGPLRFTQRQAAGKFTRAEADELIERLQAASDALEVAPAEPSPRRSASEQVLAQIPAHQLAGELQRTRLAGGRAVTG